MALVGTTNPMPGAHPAKASSGEFLAHSGSVTATGTTFQVTKGAPQFILALVAAANTAQITPAVDQAVNDLAARGFRSLGVPRSRLVADQYVPE